MERAPLGWLVAALTMSRKTIFQITNYMNANEIAHNVIFVKCTPLLPLEANLNALSSLLTNENDTTIRVVICPKKPSYGKKY